MAAHHLRVADGLDRAMPRKIALTAASVETLTCPPGKPRVYVYDTKAKGLALQITKSGAKAWYFYGRVKGQVRPIKFHLGKFQSVPLDTARRAALKVASDAAHGVNPAAERRRDNERTRNTITLETLWCEFRDQHVKPKLSANTLSSDTNQAAHLKPLFPVLITELTHGDVKGLHAKLGGTVGMQTADHTVRLLSRMMKWKGVKTNPAQGVKLNGRNSRERFLGKDEIGRLMAALDECPNAGVADVIRLALFTGVRKSNVRRARWKDIHLGECRWILSSVDHKNRKPVSISLLPPAMALLNRRETLRGESEFVFPGRTPGHPVRNVQYTWNAIRKKAGIEDVHFHDLRHTLASWMAMSGASLPVIGKQLGHRDVNSTARYAHLEADAARLATGVALVTMMPAPTSAGGITLPELPPADANGNRPAVATARVTIAREIIGRMNAAGVTAAALAKSAKVSPAKLAAILAAKASPDEAVIERIEKALAG